MAKWKRQTRIVGQDSNLVTEESTNDKIGILSHEDMEATAAAIEEPVVGQDSNPVTEDSTTDTIAILSHEETGVADRPGQGTGDRQSSPSSGSTPQKAQNKANFDSTQSLSHQQFNPKLPGSAEENKAKLPGARRAPMQRPLCHR